MHEDEAAPAIVHAIDREGRLVRSTFLGAVTVPQIEAYMRRVDADPDYELDFDALIDIREFTGPLDREIVRHLSLTIRSYTGSAGARRAVVVGNDLHFGLMRMLEAFTSVSPVIYRVFHSEDLAIQWLAERRRPPEVQP